MSKLTVSAPGKVILHGEHAVVYGKKALATSLNLRTYLRLSQREDDIIGLNFPDVDKKLSLSLDFLIIRQNDTRGDINKPDPASEETIEKLKKLSGLDTKSCNTQDLAVVSFLYLYTEISKASKSPLPAIDVSISSDLPIGAGLGSSASFAVCLAVGLLLLGGHIDQSQSRTETGTDQSDYTSWSCDEMELINKWAFISEKIVHGNPSGVDNSVATFGGAIEFRKGSITTLSKMPETKILLVNTKVPRSTKTLVAGVRAKYDKYPDVVGPVMDAIDALVTRCCQTYTRLVDNSQVTSPLYQELEELTDINQNLLRTLGVSHPRLDRVCELARTSGLHAKLTGAGGGGCAICLLRPDTPTMVVKEVMSQLKAEGFECWETSICGEGVARHWNNSCKHFKIPSDFLPT